MSEIEARPPVPDDADIAADLISGSLKRSKSYHADYGGMTYKDIKDLAATSDAKARRMKKLIEQAERLRAKGKGRRS